MNTFERNPFADRHPLPFNADPDSAAVAWLHKGVARLHPFSQLTAYQRVKRLTLEDPFGPTDYQVRLHEKIASGEGDTGRSRSAEITLAIPIPTPEDPLAERAITCKLGALGHTAIQSSLDYRDQFQVARKISQGLHVSPAVRHFASDLMRSIDLQDPLRPDIFNQYWNDLADTFDRTATPTAFSTVFMGSVDARGATVLHSGHLYPHGIMHRPENASTLESVLVKVDGDFEYVRNSSLGELTVSTFTDFRGPCTEVRAATRIDIRRVAESLERIHDQAYQTWSQSAK